MNKARAQVVISTFHPGIELACVQFCIESSSVFTSEAHDCGFGFFPRIERGLPSGVVEDLHLQNSPRPINYVLIITDASVPSLGKGRTLNLSARLNNQSGLRVIKSNG